MGNEKTVLVTGALGFIGRHLLRSLEDTEWKTIPLVRRKTSLPDEIVVDFCSEDFIQRINRLSDVDAVVHLGAKTGWDGNSRRELFVPNVLATAELANWANKIGAYFIFSSAAIACGVRNPLITPRSRPNPDTDYGYSKWLAEEIIKMSRVKHTILRIAGVFGKEGPHHLSINRAIENALNGVPPVQYGNGEIKRNYIYVEDLTNALKFCIEKEIEGTHLVAGSYTDTIAEMLQIICDRFLPGNHPKYAEGKGGQDQVVTTSPSLPKGRSFAEAIEHIHLKHMRL